MNKQAFFFVPVILVISIISIGCINGENNTTGQLSVTLVIDYGGVVKNNNVPVVETLEVKIGGDSTAFDLLDENTDLEYTEDPVYGVFVTSINGVGNLDGKYWMFYVNTEMAPVGVSAYTLSDGDTITMKFEEVSW